MKVDLTLIDREVARQEAGDRRYVSRLGDVREKPVLCTGCRRATLAYDSKCLDCYAVRNPEPSVPLVGDAAREEPTDG